MKFLTIHFTQIPEGGKATLVQITASRVDEHEAVDFLEQLDRGNVMDRDVILDLSVLRHAAPGAHDAIQTFGRTVTNPALSMTGVPRKLAIVGAEDKNGPEWAKTLATLHACSKRASAPKLPIGRNKNTARNIRHF